MACGGVPVRGIRHGDDDLIDRVNCLRSGYDEQSVYANAVRLIENPALLQTLAETGLAYRESFLRWNTWAVVLEDIFKKG